ncbi:MAG: glycosyltransferase family 4 protein, partial [bacterium]|nr:glycosyltransferase family 4 protein [bacterium]
ILKAKSRLKPGNEGEEKEIAVTLGIIGKGPYTGQLKQLTAELELENNVEFIPMLPPQEVPGALSECDIGVCAYLLNEQTHQTLPGKLFEYMAAGLPVITSARKPVVRIVEKEKCGIVYQSRDPKTIAPALAEMIKDREKLEQMGTAGYNAIREKYNQKNNLKILDDVIKKTIKTEEHE